MEQRVYPLTDLKIEKRNDDNQLLNVEGNVIRYNTRSYNLGFFVEQFAPGAFDNDIKENGDVRLLREHDPLLLLARTASGTMELFQRTESLDFRASLPNSELGNSTYESIDRGDLTGVSFMFSVVSDNWERMNDGTVLRTIIEAADFLEVSLVTFPAYESNTVTARSASSPENVFEQYQKSIFQGLSRQQRENILNNRSIT